MNNKKLWIILFTLVLVLAACGQNQSSEKGHHSTHSTEQKQRITIIILIHIIVLYL